MNKVRTRVLSFILALVICLSAPMCSYMEVNATGAILAMIGSYALEDILMDLIITSGLAVAGYQTAKSISKGSSEYESLKASLEANSTIANAVDDIAEHKVSAANTAVTDEDYTGVGYSLHGGSGTLKFQLDSGLINAAKSSVLSWFDSDENVVEEVACSVDEGTVSLDLDYCKSITTKVVSIDNRCFDVSMLDTLNFTGLYDKLCELGYPSSEYYYYITSLSPSSVKVICIPLDVSIMYFSNYYSRFLKNDIYKGFVSRIGYYNRSQFKDYLSTNSFYCDYLTISHDLSYSISSSWGSDVSLNSSSFSGYLFNYSKAYSLNSSVVSSYSYDNDFKDNVVGRIFYSFNTKVPNISYYPDSALVVNDSLTYSIPFSNADGLVSEGTSLDDLYSYVSSLTDDLDKWREEQNAFNEDIYDQNNTLIGQNAEALDALNSIDTASNNTYQRLTKIHSLLSSLNSFVGSMVSAVVSTIPMAILGINELIKAIPDEIEDVLVDVFPWAATLEDTIIALPGEIALAIADVIDIPDVVIPDIVVDIPEITIPDIVVDIPEIAIPDISVDIPDITLDPSFDITVANDWDGLGDVIGTSVAGALDDLFIPDEAATLEKVGEVGDYFKIKDDVQDAVGQFKDFLFGITPSPILKIPIGSPTSKKYKYGFGDYFIIDISWYSTYKDFGDKIILAIAWALFLWRVFLKLPGIISGTEGSIVSVNNSRDNYNDIVYPKKR